MSPLAWEARTLSAGEAWAAAASLAALAFFLARSRRKVPARFLLARAAAGLAALLLVAGPSVSLRGRRTDAPVAVVMDASASMATADEGSSLSARGPAAAESVGKTMKTLESLCAPALFRLDGRLERVKDFSARPRGASSDFSRLAEAAGALPGLKGVLFISDGRRGGGPDPRTLLAALGVPVHTVGVGNPAASADAGVDAVRAAPFGFKNVPAEARVRLRFRALPPGRARLSVVSRGKVLGSRWVDRGSEGVLEATVPFRPARTGIESFEARLDPLPGETNVKNNAMAFTMDVGRDRRRVLYICGRPGPNYAFLRQQLKADPTVELVTFVILRDMEDFLDVPERELSLIPFPAQAQLLEGLPSFDAVVFEDFSFQRFGLGAPGMEALARFVRGGGGLLLLGGRETFGPFSPYKGSALEPLIPFVMDGGKPGPARLRVKAGGSAPAFSPIDPSEGPAAWDRLPELDGEGFLLSGLRPGAAPLLSAGGAPLAAVAGAGKGRVMALASLNTWRWALAGGETGREAYVRFWSGAVSWLTGEESFRRVRLDLPPEGTAPGEEALLRVYARDDAQRPVADGEARFTVVEADGERRTGLLSPAGGGEYAASFAPRAAGPARVEVRVTRGGRLLGAAEGVLSVGSSWDESRDATPDFQELEAMSQATGGRFTPLEGFNAAWLRETLEPLSWRTRRKWPLAGAAFPAALLLLLLLAEWALRRRRGLP